jgi:predicted transposase/invertase (TIGR01784 family)
MTFNNTCKFLAENFSIDLATWLLGIPIELTKVEPTELSVEPIRADSIILLESQELLAHIEFQTDPDPDIGFRMADYRLRGHCRDPSKPMRQFVVYLRPTQSERVYQTRFEISGLQSWFEVVRLWEQPSEFFLAVPGSLPFAVLSQTQDPVETLREVAQRVEQIEDKRTQSNLAAATAILAGLLLDKVLIHQILRRDIMRESVIYQEIEAEAEAKGEARGEAIEGLKFVLRLLTRRFGEVGPETEAQIRSLSLSQLEDLGEAILDFAQPVDLQEWLQANDRSIQ